MSGSRSNATRLRTLPDFVGPGMRLLVVGLNPSVYSADLGVGFGRPGNRFWPAALTAGLVTRDRDPLHALRVDRVGMTDLVKRATPGGRRTRRRRSTATDWRGSSSSSRGSNRGAVCFLGLAGWRVAVDRKAVAGVQARELGGRPVYVMPNPSGLNAHDTVATLADHLRAALALADATARSQS